MSEATWETFHQREALTTRLRNILDEYPQGVGPFKEFLQNADDAAASSFVVVLDERQWPSPTASAPPDPADYQASLLVYNNASFSDRDFTSIISVGQSCKFRDTSKTGQYGLGFNVAYHFTDTVAFVSSNSLVMFDPHERVLPEHAPGIRVPLSTPSSPSCSPCLTAPEPFADAVLPFAHTLPLVSSLHDQCSDVSPSDGTMFRLKLRTAAEAEQSLISDVVYTREHMHTLLQEFCECASDMLLFLKFVEHITVCVIDPQGSLSVLEHVYLHEPTPEIRRCRALLTECRDEPDVDGEPRAKGQEEEEEKEVKTSVDDQDEVMASVELQVMGRGGARRWRVSARQGHGLARLAHRLQARQYAAVALPLTPLSSLSEEALISNCDGSSDAPLNGYAYCFLPVVNTQMPVHINATFALSSNRRNLWHSAALESMSAVHGLSALKSEWNKHLLTHPSMVPGAYIDALLQSRPSLSEGQPPNALIDIVYNAFPRRTATEPWSSLSRSVIECMYHQDAPLLFDSVNREWLSLKQVLILPSSINSLPSAVRKELSSEIDLCIISPPPFVVDVIQWSGVPVAMVSPSSLANLLRNRPLSLSYNSGCVTLDFILSDIDHDDFESEDQYSEAIRDRVIGCQLLPLASMELGTIDSRDSLEAMAYVFAEPRYAVLIKQRHTLICNRYLAKSKLEDRRARKLLNVYAMTAKMVAEKMAALFPRSWYMTKITPSIEEVAQHAQPVSQAKATERIAKKSKWLKETKEEPNLGKRSKAKSEKKRNKKKRRKEQTKENDNEAATPVSATCNSDDQLELPIIDTEGYEEAMQEYASLAHTLIHFVAHTNKQDLSLFKEWPLLPVRQHSSLRLVQFSQALILGVLDPDQLPDALSIEALSAYGCLIAEPFNESWQEQWNPARLILGKRGTANIVLALISTISDSKHYSLVKGAHCEAVQRLLLDFNFAQCSHSSLESLKRVPVYRTLNHCYFTSIVSARDNRVHIPTLKATASPDLSPKLDIRVYMCTPPHFYGRWDELLAAPFGSSLLSRDSNDLRLLTLVGAHHAGNQQFITSFLLPNIADLCEEAVHLTINIIAKEQPWRSKRSPFADNVQRHLSSTCFLPIEGQRVSCSQLMDPSYPELSHFGPSAYLPPTSLRRPEILQLFRFAGMTSIQTPEGFSMAARATASSNNTFAALALSSFLTKHISSISWTSHQSTLHSIAWLPCISGFSALSTHGLPMGSKLFPFLRHALRKVVAPSSRHTAPTTPFSFGDGARSFYTNAGAMNQCLEINEEALLTQALQLLREDPLLDQCRALHPSLSKLGEGQNVEWTDDRCRVTLYPAKQGVHPVFTPFVFLAENLPLQAIHVPGPPALLEQVFGADALPSPSLIVSHLERLMKLYEAQRQDSLQATNESNDGNQREARRVHLSREFVEGSVLGSLALLSARLKAGSAVATVQRRLSHIPLVLSQAGVPHKPHAVHLDLDEDVPGLEGEAAVLALPHRLRDVAPLLLLAGARATAAAGQPRVQVLGPRAPAAAIELQHALGKKAFADCAIVTGPVESDGDNQPREVLLYAHRMVLAMSSRYFHAMFTSGMVAAETRNEDGCHFNPILIIRLPFSVSFPAAWVVLHYLYTRDICAKGNRILVNDREDDVALVCEVLHIADCFQCDYLKQWCERFLATDIINLLNVCDLLTHAYGCHADQLISVCHYHIRKNFAAVSATDQYKALPEEIQNSIRRL